MDINHKFRRVQNPVGHGRMLIGGVWTEQTPLVNETAEELWSFGHDLSQLGKGGDVGGPFKSQKTWFSESKEVFTCVGFGRVYEGTLHFGNNGGSRLQSSFTPHSSNSELARVGASAIARSIPTNPMSSAAVAVGELRRDGIPNIIGHSLLKDRARDYRKIGDEYLNVEFGWKPLIADLRSFATSVKRQNKILSQLKQDSGKNVRRRLDLTHETTSTYDPNQSLGWGPPFFCTGGNVDVWMTAEIPGAPMRWQVWNETSQRRWFTGCFTYHLPDPRNGFFDKIAYYEAQANVLLGTRLTPEVVWNLAPWTWAADWFSNAGDVVHNISQFGADGLVMRYGYLMEETEVSNRATIDWAINTPTGPQKIQLSGANGSTTKYRFASSPFGFGLDFDSFSGRQLAITAALGISRGPRVAL